jgi:putative SOS response-associated peptidase YedK
LRSAFALGAHDNTASTTVLYRDGWIVVDPAGNNIAPTQDVAAVRSVDDRRELISLRWGLVPGGAPDLAIGSRMINARAETVAEKPAYRNSLKKRRCLIVADGLPV